MRGLLAVFMGVFLMTMADADGAAKGSSPRGSGLPEPSWQKLPRWRGFNLLEKFHKDWNSGPFVETDFQWISELGFNFVRLPMDYRTWIADGDWRRFNEDVLREIDRAVEWGRKYNVHVCVNFHRAPGYTVASPKEEKSLWTDPEALEVCCLHWGTFAKRYRGVPNRNLSFNLFNEPSGVGAERHAEVVKAVTDAIRKEDPDRLVICDALDFGNTPSEELLPLEVGISTRGYSPFQLTHYKASWVGDNRNWPVPQWPVYAGMSDFLYGHDDPDSQKHKTPLILKTDLAREATVTVRVHVVTTKATLVVAAGGKEVFRKVFEPGPGDGEWKESRLLEKYGVYSNLYDQDCSAKVPAGTREIRIENADGDWMTISEIRIDPFPGAEGGRAVLVPASVGWGTKQGVFTIGKDGRLVRPDSSPRYAREQLWNDTIEKFTKVQALGFGVHVGEWGSYSFTPHDVVLRWAEDCLKNWEKAGWGWAMWNFRGSFGVLDSGREDVKYEDFRGHKLDRKLLGLLQRY